MGPSCNEALSGKCTEFPASRYRGEMNQAMCEHNGGSWSTGPCARAGSPGMCAPSYGALVVLYTSHYGGEADASRHCEGMGSAWLALPPPAAVPPPVEPPLPPPPSYAFDAPPGYTEWVLLPLDEHDLNLEGYRSDRLYGATQARVVIILRTRILPDAELADALDLDLDMYAAHGLHVTSHRRTTSAGAPGVLFDGRSTTLEGEAQRTITFQVLDGSRLYTLSCGSLASTYASWRHDCDHAVASFHVVRPE